MPEECHFHRDDYSEVVFPVFPVFPENPDYPESPDIPAYKKGQMAHPFCMQHKRVYLLPRIMSTIIMASVTLTEPFWSTSALLKTNGASPRLLST